MAKLSDGFQFKQFFIAHSQCAMKVNTDGILLGALADVKNCTHILDLGTGSGLIAIMLAQRTACTTQITGVELDALAAEQAQMNARNSPWGERVTLQQADILTLKFAKKFDLIVSNPPYFEHSLASRDPQRDLARTNKQSHFAWLNKAKSWLTPEGKICFILPLETAEKLIEKGKTIGLYCNEKWLIYTKIGKQPKRAIVTFSQKQQHCEIKTLTIYQQDNQYTADFKAYTKDFYLNF